MKINKLFKEIDNIWYHYKPHIIVGVVVLAIVVYFIISMVNHKSTEAALNVVLTGNGIEAKQTEQFQNSATDDILGDSQDDRVIRTDFWPYEINDPQEGALLQKLVAMMTTHEVDVVVMDKKAFLDFASQGSFMNLDKLAKELPKETSFIDGQLQESTQDQKQAYGILLDNNSKLKEAGFDTQNKVLAIMTNTKHKQTAIQFVHWLLQP